MVRIEARSPSSASSPTDLERILELWRLAPGRGRVEDATHAATGRSPLCGDQVEWSLRLVDDRIVELAWDGALCAVSTASVARLVEAARDRSAAAVLAWSSDDALALLGARLPPARRGCVTLPLEVLQAALRAPVGGGGDT